MNSAELVTAVRVTGALPSADPTYTPARVREELSNVLQTIFGKIVVASREGYWRKTRDYQVVADQQRYRLPHRAVAGTAETVEFFSGQAPIPMYRARPDYEFQGDQIVLDSPPQGSYTLRVHYYLRPSMLVQEQDEGRVTAVDNVAKTVTVDALPDNQVTAVPIASGDELDIVHPNGWHEVTIVGEAAAIAGTVLTFGPTVDLSMVEVGDCVRAADQTEWPALPVDFHRSLADACAVSILLSKGDMVKANAMSGKVNGDIERFTSLLDPRVKDFPQATVARYGVLRSRSRYWGAR